jgi:hypothetical protein
MSEMTCWDSVERPEDRATDTFRFREGRSLTEQVSTANLKITADL